MKENAIKKINKIGKIGAIVAKIAKIFMIIGAVSLLVTGIVLMVMPKDFMEINITGTLGLEMDISKYYDGEIKEEDIDKIIGDDGSVELENGEEYSVNNVTFENGILNVEAEANNISYSLRNLGGALLSGSINMAAWVVVLVFIEKLCVAFKQCASPFEDNVLKSLNNFAISMIPWAVVSTLSTQLGTLLTSGDIVIGGGIDLTYVFILLVILGLTFVFKYGAMLQQESDETL